MTNLNKFLVLVVILSFSLIFHSCDSTQEECNDDDIFGKTIVYETDTIFNKTSTIKKGPYSIQIGAFANKKNADAFINEAKSEFKSLINIKQTPDGLYRILIGEYKTVEDAERVLDNVKKKGYPDAFIRDEFGPLK